MGIEILGGNKVSMNTQNAGTLKGDGIASDATSVDCSVMAGCKIACHHGTLVPRSALNQHYLVRCTYPSQPSGSFEATHTSIPHAYCLAWQQPNLQQSRSLTNLLTVDSGRTPRYRRSLYSVWSAWEGFGSQQRQDTDRLEKSAYQQAYPQAGS